jgi:hypothetical protein
MHTNLKKIHYRAFSYTDLKNEDVYMYCKDNLEGCDKMEELMEHKMFSVFSFEGFFMEVE